MKIFKKQIAMSGTTYFRAPANAKILYVDFQPGNGPCIWFQFDTNVDSHHATINLTTVMTGESFEDIGDYVGSFQTPDGGFVGHVFYYWDD